MKPLYQMCYLDSSNGFNNVINNQIKSLRNYIQNQKLGDLSVTMSPDQTKGIIIFTPASESVTLNGYNMYINAICNELQMENGIYHQISNESSEYDFSRFKNEVSIGIPNIMSTIDQLAGLEEQPVIPKVTETTPKLYSEGTENYEVIVPNNSKTQIDLSMIYKEIINLKEVVGELSHIVKTLANPTLVTTTPSTSEVPEEQIPDAIKEAGVNPNDTAAAEVATPTDTSVPDNNIAANQPPQTAEEHVVTEETKPEANVNVLDNENVDATTGTESVTEVITNPEIHEIKTYIDSIRGNIAGLESSDIDSAEIALNNYIISNVQSTPSNILRLFINYNFMETLANNSLVELDRVTHVRRKLHTNQLV